jgi:hypothetical protein
MSARLTASALILASHSKSIKIQVTNKELLMPRYNYENPAIGPTKRPTLEDWRFAYEHGFGCAGCHNITRASAIKPEDLSDEQVGAIVEDSIARTNLEAELETIADQPSAE